MQILALLKEPLEPEVLVHSLIHVSLEKTNVVFDSMLGDGLHTPSLGSVFSISGCSVWTGARVPFVALPNAPHRVGSVPDRLVGLRIPVANAG